MIISIDSGFGIVVFEGCVSPKFSAVLYVLNVGFYSCNLQSSFTTSCNICNNMQRSKKDCIRANRARSFQWKWSHVCLNNRFNTDSSCNIVQWAFFSFCSEWSFLKHMLSCSFLSWFSVLESAFEMLSRIYWRLQQLQQLAMLCNKVGSVTLQHQFSSLQHRGSLKTGAATLHIHCGHSVKFLTQVRSADPPSK